MSLPDEVAVLVRIANALERIAANLDKASAREAALFNPVSRSVGECGAVNGIHVCSLELGHRDDHIARVGLQAGGGTVSWVPSEEAAPAADKVPRAARVPGPRCRSLHPSGNFACTRDEGHAGKHRNATEGRNW